MDFLKKRAKNKYFVGGLILFIIIIVLIFRVVNSVPRVESAEVKIGTVVEKVSVTGKISPIEKADLSFGKSGNVSRIAVDVGGPVKKGDLILSLDNATTFAALQGAEARLHEVERGLRPEELVTEQAKVTAAVVVLDNAMLSGINSVQDSYTKAQSAILTYADTFFDTPQGVKPSISLATAGSSVRDSINNKRAIVGTRLRSWQADIAIASTTDQDALTLLFSRSHTYLQDVKDFVSDLSIIVNNLSGTGVSQSTLNTYLATMTSAMSELNKAILAVESGETTFKNAKASLNETRNQFLLKRAGSSKETIEMEMANVRGYQAQILQGQIIAPFDGVVTKIVPRVGEFVAAGATVVSVQNSGDFKIEAYVPEADIAKVAIGNSASITLDAYGQNVHFSATVRLIDPAETILENVPTYKVTFYFNEKDERIRSGMTANIDILTRVRENVLIIPFRAVIDEEGVKKVRVLRSDGKNYDTVPITTGIKGSEGTIETVSGLTEGQRVVILVK